MLKIGEFSKLSRISIRMLRYYDEIGLLVPEMVDDVTGYRYYEEVQLLYAQRIQVLKELGFGLAATAEIMDNYEDAESMERFLSIKKGELLKEAEETGRRIRLLDNTINWLRKDGNLMDYNVTLKTLPERYVASVRQVIPAYHDEGILWKTFSEEAGRQHIQCAVPGYGLAIFHDEGFKDSDVDVEIQVAVTGTYEDTDQVKFKKVEAVEMASATYKGSYDQITRVNMAVAQWISENGYEFDGPCFCIYHVSPGDTQKEEELVTEVCCPVKRRA